VQLAFIVAFGVLLDTFVVRSLLVPAATYDLGRVIWWPSRLGRQGERGDGRAAADHDSAESIPAGATRRSLRAAAERSPES